jgi:hypothetical protein
MLQNKLMHLSSYKFQKNIWPDDDAVCIGPWALCFEEE